MAGNMTGGAPVFTQWYNPPGQLSGASPVGAMPPQPWARSVLDARRMMNRREPQAEYPDGYLGTITTRRGDRLLDSLKARVNERSYQRGAHLGERIDPGDYLWPDELDPMRGIMNEAQGLKTGPLLQYFQPTPVVDGKMAPRGSESVLTIDRSRSSQLSVLRPRYGFPVRSAPYQG